MTKRNVAADILRVVSIFYIVGFWHLTGYGHVLPQGLVTHVAEYATVLALALFTVLSGYFLGRKSIRNGRDLSAFYTARFLSIYVPYLAALGVFALAGVGDRSALLGGALLIGMFDRPPPGTLWFANMIVLFYLVAPLLIVLRARTAAFIGVCLAIEVLCFLLNLRTGSIDGRLMLYFPCFVAGMVATRIARPSARLVLASGIAAFVGLVLSAGVDVPVMEQSPLMIPWAVFASLTCVFAALHFGTEWKQTRILAALTDASFFIYLTHRVVFKVIIKALPTSDPWLKTAELLLIGLPVTILVSWTAQYLYNFVLRASGLTADRGRGRRDVSQLPDGIKA